MKALTSVLTLAAFSILVLAHGGDNLEARRQYARQAPSSTSSHSGPTIPTTSGPVSSNSVNPSVTANTSSTPSITVSLLSTNPTAVPLASIVSNQSSLPIPTISTTETPGPGPTNIPNAPPLPDVSNLNVNDYPKWDVPPPIDSPEVQQWIKEVHDTGIVIPNLPPTNLGGCANNTQITNPSDPNVCWWPCGGCTKSSDITECPVAGEWGLTYDDGPSFYTPNLLKYLDEQKLKSTFFVVGSRVIEFFGLLQVQYMSGHQIGVHTWSHSYMSTLSNEQIIAEFGWTKKVTKDVTGVTPSYWRPPYGDVDNRVRAIAAAMGLRTVIWSRNKQTGATYDTGDFNIKAGTITIQQVLQNWKYIVGNATGGFIVLQHDLFEQTVEAATGYILPDALAHVPAFNITPVVNCLGMPMANAYIETNDNKSNPPPILNPTDVTTSHVASSTGGSGSSSSSDARFSVEFNLMSIMTIITLLAGVYAARF